MIPTDCPECEGAGYVGHMENGPCETCGGWTDKKRLIHRTREVIQEHRDNGIIQDVPFRHGMSVNIRLEPVIVDDVNYIDNGTINRVKALEWFKKFKPRTEGVASGSFRVKADAFDEIIQKAEREISKLILGPESLSNASESSKGVPGHNQAETPHGATSGTTGSQRPNRAEEIFRASVASAYARKPFKSPKHAWVKWKDGKNYLVCLDCKSWFLPQPTCPSCGATENPPKETE